MISATAALKAPKTRTAGKALAAILLVLATVATPARSMSMNPPKVVKPRAADQLPQDVPTAKDTAKEKKQQAAALAAANSAGSSTPDAEEAPLQLLPEDDDAKIGTIRVYGPDQKGIVAGFSQMLYGHGCGIVESEQHTEHDVFFQRIRFDYTELFTDRLTLTKGISDVCDRFAMEHSLEWGNRRKQVALMVSKYDHCLWEVLLRKRAGELDCDIACIMSNHADLEPIANSFNIPFHVFPMTKENKKEVEAQQLALLRDTYKVDLVVMARYMQIVSENFCQSVPAVMNIHHSFLPAFVGSRPYHRAHERGVKLIGATAHYATAELDEGPIIEQDICRISHKDDVDDLIAKGRLLEKNVLVTAVKAHIEDRVTVYNNKCVVFDG